MDKRKNNKGTIGNKGGRPPKAEEQKIIEKLSPLSPLAFQSLKNAITDEKSWAVKLYFDYMYGKPKESKTIDFPNGIPIVDLSEW